MESPVGGGGTISRARDDAGFWGCSRCSRRSSARIAVQVTLKTKKKELVENFKNAGREWQPKGTPSLVRVHDFPTDARPSRRIWSAVARLPGRLQRAVAMVSCWPRKRTLMRPRALRCLGCSPWPWTRIGRQASRALGGATRFTNSRLRWSWSATWEAFKPPLLSSMGALTNRRGAGPSRKSTRSQRGPSSPCAGKALSNVHDDVGGGHAGHVHAAAAAAARGDEVTGADSGTERVEEVSRHARCGSRRQFPAGGSAGRPIGCRASRRPLRTLRVRCPRSRRTESP